jgi:pimeloyl-ACP methyl ester carboxylesterase
MPALAFTRSGTGAPLVLLHGIGSSRRAWDPVVPDLARRFDVIAVDLPGCGDSAAPLSPGAAEPAALAASVAGLLDELGVAVPHLAGNSLGGWVALELARCQPAASVTLLSPAGLWRRGTPRYCQVSLRASRFLARHGTGLLTRVVRFRLGRAVVLGQTHGRPLRMRVGYARAAVTGLASSAGFEAELAGTRDRRFTGGTGITAPVTVAFGSRDVLLLRHQSRHLDELPASTQTAALPGCGHVPMADDPAAVAALITAATLRGRGRADAAPGTRPAPAA